MDIMLLLWDWSRLVAGLCCNSSHSKEGFCSVVNSTSKFRFLLN